MMLGSKSDDNYTHTNYTQLSLAVEANRWWRERETRRESKKMSSPSHACDL